MSQDIKLRGRIMYPHLHQPHKFDAEDEAQYRCTIVIAANDPSVEAINAQTQSLVQSELDGVQPTAENMPLKREANNPNVADCYVIRAKSNQKPSVVDRQLQPIMDPAKPADGDWCWFAIRLFAYNKRGAKGVSAALNSVLFDTPGGGRLATTGPAPPEEIWGDMVGKSEAPNPFG